jgi:uncharacterized protein VirK/YbjX
MEALTAKPLAYATAKRPRLSLRRSPAYKAASKMLGLTLNLPRHIALSRLLEAAGVLNREYFYSGIRYRYLRNYYLGGGFAVADRLQVAIQHYEYVDRHFQPEFLTACRREGHVLWSRSHDDVKLDIALRFPSRFNYDGDLCLSMEMNGASLYCMTFSIAPGEVLRAAEPQVLLIAAIQGLAGRIEEIRRVTEICDNIAPPQLLLMAAEALSAALGIKAMVGIGQGHMPAPTVEQGRGQFDYDAFWSAVAGAADGDFYRMPLPFTDKPIESIAAKHRNRARKRRELRDALRHDIALQSHANLARTCLR